jgi:hypothetical protein
LFRWRPFCYQKPAILQGIDFFVPFDSHSDTVVDPQETSVMTPPLDEEQREQQRLAYERLEQERA